MATNNFDRKKETASFRVEKEILFVFFLPNEGHAHLPNKSPAVANGKKSAPIQTESVSITEQIRAKQTNKPTNKRTAPAIERRSAAESGRVPFLFDQKKKKGNNDADASLNGVLPRKESIGRPHRLNHNETQQKINGGSIADWPQKAPPFHRLEPANDRKGKRKKKRKR